MVHAWRFTFNRVSPCSSSVISCKPGRQGGTLNFAVPCNSWHAHGPRGKECYMPKFWVGQATGPAALESNAAIVCSQSFGAWLAGSDAGVPIGCQIFKLSSASTFSGVCYSSSWLQDVQSVFSEHSCAKRMSSCQASPDTTHPKSKRPFACKSSGSDVPPSAWRWTRRQALCVQSWKLKQVLRQRNTVALSSAHEKQDCNVRTCNHFFRHCKARAQFWVLFTRVRPAFLWRGAFEEGRASIYMRRYDLSWTLWASTGTSARVVWFLRRTVAGCGFCSNSKLSLTEFKIQFSYLKFLCSPMLKVYMLI